MNITEKLNSNNKNMVSEKELEHLIGIRNYEDFAREVGRLVQQNVIKPVKSKKSGTNGRIPPLYNKYRIIRNETDYTKALEEIKLLNPRLNVTGYLEKPVLFEKHGKLLLRLSDYLWTKAALLNGPMSQNERSLSIWGFEKLLGQKEALIEDILKFNGLNNDDLNYYNTPEPFIEYVHERTNPMNILIIENKDTWFSLRKVMLETGLNRFLGIDIHALLYGEGRKITGKNGRIDEYDKQWYHGNKNMYYYFGDMDYEGIQIYFDLKSYNTAADIRLFKEAYLMMVRFADGCTLPISADRRNRAGSFSGFLEYFPEEEAGKIGKILESGRYIPQEIINYQIIRKCMGIT
jgi:Uncharacterized protein conserved in bacteria C-term(DUF2220).